MSHCLTSFKFSRARQHETLSPTLATHKDPSVFPWANPSLCLSALQVNVTLFFIRLQKCLRTQQVHWAKELVTETLGEQKAPVWRRPVPAHTLQSWADRSLWHMSDWMGHFIMLQSTHLTRTAKAFWVVRQISVCILYSLSLGGLTLFMVQENLLHTIVQKFLKDFERHFLCFPKLNLFD